MILGLDVHTGTRKVTHTQTGMHARMHAHTHNTHMHTHTCIHTHMQTHTHAHPHKHTPDLKGSVLKSYKEQNTTAFTKTSPGWKRKPKHALT